MKRFWHTWLLLLVFIVPGTIMFPAAQPAQAAFTRPTTVTMFIERWNGDMPSGVRCEENRADLGCSATGRIFPPSQPVTINIENFYLPDVVAKETRPNEFLDSALRAEAVAARSFVFWHIDRGQAINNISQAFLAHTVERLASETPVFTNPTNTCVNANLSTDQRRVCTAVTAGRDYMTPRGSDRPIKAAYLEDIADPTDSYPANDPNGLDDYLVGVRDPISPAAGGCGVVDYTFIDGLSYGMSQKGMGRWSRGEYCYTGNPPRPYGVRWTRWQQLLVHYYTQIDIRNANGNIITPDNRWNPLGMRWGSTSSIAPPVNVPRGSSLAVRVDVQNTGVRTWTCNPDLSYLLQGRLLNTNLPQGQVTWFTELCPTLTPGATRANVTLTLPIPPTLQVGSYILAVDVISRDSQGDTAFGDAGWPPYTVRLCIDCYRISLPLNFANGPAMVGP